jgi:hypothetical protein
MTCVAGCCARRERPFRCTPEAYDEFASSLGASPAPKIVRAYRVRGLQGNGVARRVVAEPLASSVAHAAALALADRVKDWKSAARRALELEPNSHVGPIEQLFDRFGGPTSSARLLTACAGRACRSKAIGVDSRRLNLRTARLARRICRLRR